MNPILFARQLGMAYGSSVPLHNLDLDLAPGRIVGLLGPNGSGKTTLMKLINGLLKPTGGTLLIDGIAPGIKTKELVSYLPDRNFLNPSSTMEENLCFFSDFYKDFDRAKAEDMLKKLDVDPGKKLYTMSKGTLEKALLILVMSRRAKLYCLDEPIAGVDPATRDYILSTILGNYQEDSTILISTHLILEVENLLDEFLFLKDGKLLAHSSVEEVRNSYGLSLDAYFREVFQC